MGHQQLANLILDTAEVAAYLEAHPRTVQRYVVAGLLRPLKRLKDGTCLFYRPDVLQLKRPKLGRRFANGRPEN